jgi:outer membrane protein TolC
MTHTLRILIFLSLTLSIGINAQDVINALEADVKPEDAETSFKVPDETKFISLRLVVEEGLRNNLGEKLRRFQKEEFQLNWDMAHDKFWFPKLSLSLQTNPQLVDKFYTNNDLGNGTPRTPNGLLSLGFEDYSVFNWGKDYIDYVNAQNTFSRRTRAIKEQQRSLRFALIAGYFKFIWSNRIVEVKKRQLRHTSFIYRLAKEKSSSRKIGSQEFLQSKAEYLRSHAEYHESLIQKSEAQQELAELMGDRAQTNYRVTEQLRFKTLSILQRESFNLGTANNPNLLESKYSMENMQRDFDKRLKDNMPLPQFTVNLGAYQKSFSTAGTDDGLYTDTSNRNIELKASINASWTLWGEEGWLNSRLVKKQYLTKRKAETTFYDAKRKVYLDIRSLHQQITYFEKKFEANSAQFKNAQNAFDKALDNYIGSKTPFINVKHLLDEYVKSFTEMETSKYKHMVYKLKLAETIGIDDFPGENFENLVVE